MCIWKQIHAAEPAFQCEGGSTTKKTATPLYQIDSETFLGARGHK